jgi:chorismate lyase/3-hydroxybenzoate synthase
MDRLLSKPAAAPSVSRARAVRELEPPAWVHELPGGHFALLSTRVADVGDLSPAQFEQRTFDAYVSIAARLADSRLRHPVRFWNHVPFITDPADAGRDNYMVFNAGRFRAFTSWFGGPAQFDRDVATASATGHRGRDLVVHCLATDAPGVAVNNPRQVAPYHYSQRFGPLPPCFARATRLANPPGLLLVGGTASVRGEDSVHADDLASQLRESFLNLAALTGAAAGRKPTATAAAATVSRLLATFRELRVYYPNPKRTREIESAIRAAFPSLRQLEMLHADLCRAELLVEIEGVADLSTVTAP